VILLALAAFFVPNWISNTREERSSDASKPIEVHIPEPVIPTKNDARNNTLAEVVKPPAIEYGKVVYRDGVCYITLDPTKKIDDASDDLMKPIIDGAEFLIYPFSRNFDNDANTAADKFRTANKVTSQEVGVIKNFVENRWGKNAENDQFIDIDSTISLIVPPKAD